MRPSNPGPSRRPRSTRSGADHTLVGVFALGAVDDIERELLSAHVATCESCARETQEFRDTSALLGMAVAQDPPARLRDRVFAEVARTRQASPVLTQQIATTARPTRRRRPALWTVAAGICALALGTVTYAVTVAAENSELRDRTNRIVAAHDQVARIQSAADARTVTTAAGAAPTIVTLSRTLDAWSSPAAPCRRYRPDGSTKCGCWTRMARPAPRAPSPLSPGVR